MLNYIAAALHKIKHKKIDMDKSLNARIARGDKVADELLRRHKDYRCCVCAITRNEMFMVHDHVWAEAGFAKADFACFPCFANRIKRPLTIEDFVQALGNEMMFHAYKMGMECATATAKNKSST